MVLSDWIGYLVAGSGLGLGQLARAIRMARAVRLLRLLRMQEVLANLTERLQSDVIEIVMQIVKMVILLVMLCHFMACFWWAVGTNGDGTSWVKAGAFDDLSADASYLVCLLGPCLCFQEAATISTRRLRLRGCMELLPAFAASFSCW